MPDNKHRIFINPNLSGLQLEFGTEARTHTYVVSENTPFSTKALLILLMLASFCKNATFFGKNSTFTQSNIVKPGRDFLVIF